MTIQNCYIQNSQGDPGRQQFQRPDQHGARPQPGHAQDGHIQDGHGEGPPLQGRV